MKRFWALLMCLLLLCPAAPAEDYWGDFEVGGDERTLSEEEAELLEELDGLLGEPVDVSDLEINPDLPDYVVNILLLGVDNRSVALASGRSDATLICSINKRDGSITLTTIARDSAVEIPGYQSRKRVNLAFKYGSAGGDIAQGARLAVKTINRNYQMNIPYYVVVNIHGLADIIEALGGLDMDLTAGEASAINYELFVKEPMGSNAGRQKLQVQDGIQHLDGMQAVTYGRIRNLKGQNDLDRNGRQRKLMEQLISTVMEGLDLPKLVGLIETALPYGETNLTAEELLPLGLAVLGGKGKIKQFGIPLDGEYTYRGYDGLSLLYVNPQQMQTTLAAMQQLIYGQSYVHAAN